MLSSIISCLTDILIFVNIYLYIYVCLHIFFSYSASVDQVC